MLAARTAAEISPGQQHGSTLIFGPIQFEVGIVRTVFEKPPIEEQVFSKASPFDPLQELLGDDLIGIDVRPIERKDSAGVDGEGKHAVLDESRQNEIRLPRRTG